MILKFILLFISLFTTFLLVNIKMTITARAIAFREYESFGESKKTFVIMLFAVLSWALYLTLY